MSANEIREFLEMAKEMPNIMINLWDGKIDVLVHDKEVFSEIVGANDFQIEEYKGSYQLIYVENDVKYTSWED